MIWADEGRKDQKEILFQWIGRSEVLCFKSCRVAVSNKDTAVSNRPVVEAAEKLNLEEAVAVVLVLAVLVMGLVLDMEKDLPMMEEEKGRPYLQLERQIHLLDS